MNKMCVVCHTREMTFRCIQCHKPVCDECAFKDANGAFCCRECSASYKAYKEYPPAVEKARPRGNPIAAVLLVVILLAAAAYAAWKLGLIPEETKKRIRQAARNATEKIEAGKTHQPPAEANP